MTGFIQAERRMSLNTPLGDDKLLVVAVRGMEGISQLFRFELELITEESSVAFDRLLGQKVTMEWRLEDEPRYINGIVSRFAQCERSMNFTRYRMEIVPRLWLLTRKARSRIFQHITVPDILKEVFEGLDVSYELVGSFKERDYCAQYRETDFQFVSRLMEEEGIFYFFTHDAGSHKLVVANSPQSHPDLSPDTVIYDELSGGTREEDRIWQWEKTQDLRSGKYTLWDHCFELPGKNLEATKTTLESVQLGRTAHKLNVANDALELYDYPGGYAQRFDGVDKTGGDRAEDVQGIFEDNQRTVDLRMQAETAPALTINGAGGCRNFTAGHKFTLDRHFSDGGKYVLTSVEHRSTQPIGTGRDQVESFTYENSFSCIPFGVPFRPQRVTPLPVVRGTQTAVVVGPAGEEIFTDKYGRVKVQFHWDREGKKDVDSSCWVRVATLWAGKQWGVVHIPRIGQEVVVDFLEGDPDRPIIVGSVYNAEQMPPYTLPDNKTQSGIKSRSSKQGGPDNFNEIRLEDKKGEEQIFVHAEKDLLTEVEHDETRTVGHDRTTTIKNHETKEVTEGNETTTIKKGDRTVEVTEGKQTHTIKGDTTLVVKQGNHSTTIDTGNQTNQVKLGNQENTIDTGNKSTNIKTGNMTTKIDLGKSEEEAMQSIELKVGQSSIKIDQKGVTIKGMMIKVEGQVQVDIKGLMTTVKADAVLTANGALTKIN